MKLDKAGVLAAFQAYVAAYDAKDPKIKLKIDHTYRVASMCRQIAAQALKPSESVKFTTEAVFRETSPDAPETASADLAWLTGMLHDIGRFEQVRRYGTFKDADSVDHARLGADLLFQEQLLERLVPNCYESLSGEDRRILEISIRNHSAYRVQAGLSEREQTYCDILRDADKVDIFRVNWDTPMEDIYNVTTRELKEASVSEEVKECFLHKTSVLRSLKKTAIDHLVGHLCLTFELVYPISRQLAKKQGYVDKLLEFQSDNPQTQAWFRYMKAHIWDDHLNNI